MLPPKTSVIDILSIPPVIDQQYEIKPKHLRSQVYTTNLIKKMKHTSKKFAVIKKLERLLLHLPLAIFRSR